MELTQYVIHLWPSFVRCRSANIMTSLWEDFINLDQKAAYVFDLTVLPRSYGEVVDMNIRRSLRFTDWNLKSDSWIFSFCHPDHVTSHALVTSSFQHWLDRWISTTNHFTWSFEKYLASINRQLPYSPAEKEITRAHQRIKTCCITQNSQTNFPRGSAFQDSHCQVTDYLSGLPSLVLIWLGSLAWRALSFGPDFLENETVMREYRRSAQAQRKRRIPYNRMPTKEALNWPWSQSIT